MVSALCPGAGRETLLLCDGAPPRPGRGVVCPGHMMAIAALQAGRPSSSTAVAVPPGIVADARNLASSDVAATLPSISSYDFYFS